MKQNVSPIVVGIVFAIVIAILIFLGFKVFGGGGGTKPLSMDYKIPPPAASAAHKGAVSTSSSP